MTVSFEDDDNFVSIYKAGVLADKIERDGIKWDAGGWVNVLIDLDIDLIPAGLDSEVGYWICEDFEIWELSGIRKKSSIFTLDMCIIFNDLTSWKQPYTVHEYVYKYSQDLEAVGIEAGCTQDDMPQVVATFSSRARTIRKAMAEFTVIARYINETVEQSLISDNSEILFKRVFS